METKALRESITLSDLLAIVDSSNLRDLLKSQNNNDSTNHHHSPLQGPSNSITLYSLIAREKHEHSAAAAAVSGCRDSRRSGRTLLEIIQNEQQTTNNSSVSRENNNVNGINWNSFMDRLGLRRAIPEVSGASAPSQETTVSTERSNIVTPATSEGQQPARVSLMALLEQTDRQWSWEDEGVPAAALAARIVDEMDEEVAVPVSGSNVCCVCLARQKGAAFIPCGHTFCRVCSRELWVSRGSCPLCNGYIVEILDIF